MEQLLCLNEIYMNRPTWLKGVKVPCHITTTLPTRLVPHGTLDNQEPEPGQLQQARALPSHPAYVMRRHDISNQRF